MKNRIKNPKWRTRFESLANSNSNCSFYQKDGFETKNMGPGGPFLYFAYLTHVKDMAVMLGIAIPDAIGATKLHQTNNEIFHSRLYRQRFKAYLRFAKKYT